jgi:hypothetical protein
MRTSISSPTFTTSGQTDAQGNARPPRQGILNFVMAKKDGKWQIVVMHNLDLTALPPPPK